MKAYALALLFLLILFSSSCDIEPTTSPAGTIDFCIWDKNISEDLADEIFDNWVNKWKPEDAVPDSFFINRYSLEELAIGHCGFRVYYGLKKPKDLTSMGLVFVAVDDCQTDLILDSLDVIYFTDITQVKKKDPDLLPKKISLKRAMKYVSNWRHYNQVCLESDVLGNKICEKVEFKRKIAPRGILDSSLFQIVPLGHTFTGLEVFEELAIQDPNASAYVFYNCMYSYTDEDTISGYRYDLYIRGYTPSTQKDSSASGTIVEIVNSNSGFAVDITRYCPPFCSNVDLLQTDFLDITEEEIQ